MTDQQRPITIPPDLEEELLGLWPQEALQRAAQWGAELRRPEPEGPTPSDEELMALAVTVFEDPFATDKDYARAVLARWGK